MDLGGYKSGGVEEELAVARARVAPTSVQAGEGGGGREKVAQG